MVDTKAKGLHAKLAEVMAEADRIPKNGTAHPSMGGYKFVQVGDAADFVRKALGSRGVSMLPTTLELLGQAEHQTAKGGTMTTAELRVTWTLTDGETGESAVIQSYGVGADTGDKYSGKATTSAMKYALLSGFLLSTGEDTELTDTSDRRAQRPPAQHSGPPDRPPLVRRTGENGLVGKLATSGTQDFNLRETPEGMVLPFRVKEGNRAGQIVIAHGDLAVALEKYRETVIGQNVTVWGEFSDEESPPKADGFVVRFTVLHLTRIQGPDFILPAVQALSLPAQELANPLFPDEDEQRAIYEAEMAEATAG